MKAYRRKEKMAARERIKATVKGQPVDKPPVFLWLNAHTGCKLIAEHASSSDARVNIAAKYLWKKFKRGGEMDAAEIWRMAPLMFDVHTFNWANEYSYELGGDIIMASFATPWHYAKFGRENGKILITDIFGVKRSIGGIYPDMTGPVIKDLRDAKNYKLPDPKNEKYYSIFKKTRSKYPDACISAEVWGPQDFTSTSMVGTEKFMMWLIDYPEEMTAFMTKWTDFQIEVLRQSVRAGADTVTIYDDYGYDNRTFISMNMWKEFTYPHLKRLVDAAHESGALAMHHSCGYQMPILDYYVEAGVDMLQAFQPKAGNNFEEAYRKYAGRLTFITGIDIQLGEFMSAAELKKDILKNYAIGGKNGYHVLGTTHEIQYTMPDENIKTILETIKEIQSGSI